jgi:hypothetical protein
MDTKEFNDPKNHDKILGELRKMRDGTSSLVEPMRAHSPALRSRMRPFGSSCGTSAAAEQNS